VGGQVILFAIDASGPIPKRRKDAPLPPPSLAVSNEAKEVREAIWRLERWPSGHVLKIVLPSRASVVIVRNLFQRMAEIGTEIHLEDSEDVRLEGVTSVVLRRAPARAGKTVSLDAGGVIWDCTQDQWINHAAMLEPFRRGVVGHQYLSDESVDDLLVEASYGELKETSPRTTLN
jgi:hypothetical protein